MTTEIAAWIVGASAVVVGLKQLGFFTLLKHIKRQVLNDVYDEIEVIKDNQHTLELRVDDLESVDK